MSTTLNETHDPALRSWVASANAADTDFPIQNLPFAVFRRRGSGEAFRGGVAIGDRIVDLQAALAAGVFEGDARAGDTAADHQDVEGLGLHGLEGGGALFGGKYAHVGSFACEVNISASARFAQAACTFVHYAPS